MWRIRSNVENITTGDNPELPSLNDTFLSLLFTMSIPGLCPKLIFTSISQLLTEQPLNLVKKDRKRKPSSIEVRNPAPVLVLPLSFTPLFQGNSDVVICKLCNSYVVQSMIDVHNR